MRWRSSFGLAERLLGPLELALAALELGDDPGELGLDARDLVVGGIDTGGSRGLRGELLAAPRPRARRPRGRPARHADGPRLVPRNATSASASAVDAPARASAAASTSPSSASSRSRAAVRSSRPRCQPSARRARSRSRARRRAAARVRESVSASVVRRSCFVAISACCCSGFSCRRSSESTSARRSRSWSRFASLRSARSLRRRCFAMPAASSMYLRRSSGLASSTSSSWPWPTTVCSARPMPGLAQQFLHVEQPHDLAVDAVLRFARTEDRARDLDLAHRHRDLAGRVVDHELDLGHAERGSRRACRRRSRRPCARRAATGRPARRAPS